MPTHKSKRPRASAEGVGRGLIGQRKSARLAGRVSRLEALPTDVLTKILSCLCWKELLKVRVSKRLRQMSLITPAIDKIRVRRLVQGKWHPKSDRTAHLDRFAEALPMVQSLDVESDHSPPPHIQKSWIERMIEKEAGPERYMKIKVKQLLSFRHIRHLNISYQNGHLQGYGPSEVIFSLSTSEELDIGDNEGLEFDLSDVARLTRLKSFHCRACHKATGSLASLSHLQDKLESLCINFCGKITGNLTELASFSKLRELYMFDCGGITGDMGDIQQDHFLAIETFRIAGSGVRGGELDSIDDAPDIMSAWSNFLNNGSVPRPISKKQIPWGHSLSLFAYSHDNFEAYPYRVISPLFKAGQRAGFVWANKNTIEEARGITKVTWLDPEPQLEDPGYAAYAEELGLLNALLASKSSTNAFCRMTRPPQKKSITIFSNDTETTGHSLRVLYQNLPILSVVSRDSR